MPRKNTLDEIKSLKMLRLWGQLPNPNYQFFVKSGVNPQNALRDLSYTPEIQSAILAREAAVIGDPWEIIGSNPEEASFIKNNLTNIGINSIIRDIFHALWYGYTVLQHPIVKKGKYWEYQQINSLPSEWFAFNNKSELIPHQHTNKSTINTTIGEINKEVELVQYRSGINNPYGESLLARVFWSATWIRGTMDLWISYIDRFGDDSIIGKIDLANNDRKNAMLHAIQEFRGSGAMVIEGSDSIDILKSDKNGSSQLFQDFYETCTKQIFRIILGHANSLDSTPGKLGNESSIGFVRQDITQDDKSFIADTINRLIKHICILNGFGHIYFQWNSERDEEKHRIQRDTALYQMGVRFSTEYFQKTYGLNSDDISINQ